MFKKLALLLISLVAVPVAINCGVNSFNNATMVYADEEDPEEPQDLSPSPYSYTEDPFSEYETVVRYYNPCLLIPTVQKKFCAPSGYTFVLSYTDEQVDALLEEMDRCKAKYNQWMMDCIFYYGLEGTMVYSDSDPEYPNGRDAAREYILNCINNRKLYEIKELIVPTNLSFKFEFEFCAEETNYKFVLENNSIPVEPYDEYDFISVYANYYVRSGEHRFTVSADLIDGFFYEEPGLNENGFHTDSMHDEWGQEKADCEVTFFAHDTIPLGTMTRVNSYGIEMYYSDADLDIRARLTFVSGGVTYTYWSKPIVVGNPKLHTIVDGYTDRDFIQRGQKHLFTVGMNERIFNAENLFSGSIEVDAYPSKLCDADYGHIYASKDEFPSVGQVGHYYYVLAEGETYNPNDGSFETGYGSFYVWNEEEKRYEHYWGETVVQTYVSYDDYYDEETGEFKQDIDLEELLTNVSSLPFNGEWTFGYHAWMGNSYISMSLEESYGETIQVVSGSDEEETIILNVPDEVNLFTGGDAIEIIPTLSSYDEHLVYYFENSLSKEGVVSVTQDEDGKLTLAPISAGVVTLTITAESRLFDKIEKIVEIHVVDAIYDVAKIDAPTGYISAGANLRCALNVRGLNGFQNLDIDWTVLNRNGEAVSKDKLVDNKDASITILNADIGDYTISASYKGVELDTITRQVRYQSASVDTTDDEIVLNVPDSINLLSSGDALDIIASVSNYDENIEYYFDYAVSKENIISINETEDGKLTVSPLNSGTVNLTVTVNYEPNHKLTKTINVRVLDAIYDVSSIQVPDEFHYAGKDLNCAINIRGFTGFQNLNVEWVVTNKKGEVLPEEQVIDNGDATITIVAPDSDDYTISASYDGIQLDTVIVKVRYVDMNKFLRINIWWIFLITMGFVALLIFLKTIMRRSKTTVENIERVYQVYCQCLSDDKLTKEELMTIKKAITKCLHRCEDLNIDALNQYEKATRYLRKSLFDVKTLIDNYDTTSPADRGVYTDRLDKDLSKALNVAKEIENAKGLIENYHTQANRQNFEVLKEDVQNDDHNN